VAAGCSTRNLRPPGSLSLYLHVPFCRSKCGYCDFFSVPEPPTRVVEAVLREMRAELECFEDLLCPSRVDTVYVGGGTPSLLSPSRLSELLDRVRGFVARVGGRPREWTVEVNPESLTSEHLDVLAGNGVTRLSVGIQSFDDRVLSTLGRPGDARASGAALALVRSRWRGQLSLDLITGTPGQGWASLDRDVRRALAAAPHHLSLYSLTLDDRAHPLARRLDPDRQDRLWLAACRRLEVAGYPSYEISNFARPGFECLHNLRYWHLEPYLGVGPGAVSTLPDRNGGVQRLSHPRSLEVYLQGAPADWGLQSERIGPRALLLESLMMGLRLAEGIEARSFASRFGADLPDLLPRTWRRFTDSGLTLPSETGERRYALSFEGRMILDRLLAELQDEIAGLPEERVETAWGE
jgi:oxygen-independent coproporphyrinogen-3 oxidase